MRYPSRLVRRWEPAEGILGLRLTAPEGYRFRAGQWSFLNLPDRGLQDERGLRRHLTMASAPQDAELWFATKVSGSAFKQTLLRLEEGAEIDLEGPRGNFSLPEGTEQPLAFLAGGIGITPFRAMLRHAARARTGHRITLFYSNRRPEETPFLDDLREAAASAPGLRVVATMTRMAESSRPWDGPKGRLTADLIREGCPEWREALFFLAGPPPMVEAMQATLAEMGIPAERVRNELFVGYAS